MKAKLAEERELEIIQAAIVDSWRLGEGTGEVTPGGCRPVGTKRNLRFIHSDVGLTNHLNSHPRAK